MFPPPFYRSILMPTAALLLGACSNATEAPDTDASTSSCITELPYPSCGGETARLFDTESRDFDPDGAPTTAEVVSLEAIEGGGVILQLSGAPSVFRLPAAPSLSVGDAVTVFPGPLGWRLDANGVTVAFQGATSREIVPTDWAVSGSTERATVTVAGIQLGLTPACAGWAQLASCGVTVPDEGVIYYTADYQGTAIDGPQVFDLGDGRMVTIDAGDTFRGAWPVFRSCEDTCAIARPVGFGVSMVFSPAERTCSGLPTRCVGGPIFQAANVYGSLTDGNWTVVQTAVADARTMVELQQGDESAWLSLPADPLFEDDETVEITRDAAGVRIEALDLESAIYLGPYERPGDTLEIGPFSFETSASCGGWVAHHVSPDLCPVEAAEALSLTLEGTTIAPGEVVGISNATADYTVENRGVFRTIENSEPGDQCMGCADPEWGRSAVLVVRTPR
ncbi:MAG: hypothetical protein JJ863_27415 [Deltaproteobacteria bacterium]|nr:hypothetical protein [Deltaproteobacteria bacterium]